VIFHPVTSEQDTIEDQAGAFFDSLQKSGRNFVVIHPNNDPGSEQIMNTIEGLPDCRFRKIPSMRFQYFSCLMKHAKAILGNSSAGVREAPFLGIPSLNVGTRQHNRADAPSIVHASCFDEAVIEGFLARKWGLAYNRDPSFGQGKAAQSFVKCLREDKFWKIPLQKHFSDEVVDAFVSQSPSGGRLQRSPRRGGMTLNRRKGNPVGRIRLLNPGISD
jgi:UDP-N-acetylglucosamine 2-epimerase (hydrolysing)